MIRLFAMLLLATVWGASAMAQCRVALALALDVSSSVDTMEYSLQRDGIIAALRDPAVQELIFDPSGSVALAIYEWSGRRQQVMVQNWIELHGPAELEQVITAMGRFSRSQEEFPTALGYAIGYGAAVLRQAPECRARVLDISGDGINNDGFAPSDAYRANDFGYDLVNALVVGGDDAARLSAYFRDEVIYGPGAFVEVAADYTDYARAIRRKLLRELSPPLLLGLSR